MAIKSLSENEVEWKFLKKLQTTVIYNYFSLILLTCIAGWLSFFFEAKLILIILWTPMIIFALLLFYAKSEDVITSVGIYKYQEIFMEILKSIMPKKWFKNLFNGIWKKISK